MVRLAGSDRLDRLFETTGAVAAQAGGGGGQGGEFRAPAMRPTCLRSTFERVPAASAAAGLQCLLRVGARPHGGAQSSRFAQGSQARLKIAGTVPISRTRGH